MAVNSTLGSWGIIFYSTNICVCFNIDGDIIKSSSKCDFTGKAPGALSCVEEGLAAARIPKQPWLLR